MIYCSSFSTTLHLACSRQADRLVATHQAEIEAVTPLRWREKHTLIPSKVTQSQSVKLPLLFYFFRDVIHMTGVIELWTHSSNPKHMCVCACAFLVKVCFRQVSCILVLSQRQSNWIPLTEVNLRNFAHKRLLEKCTPSWEERKAELTRWTSALTPRLFVDTFPMEALEREKKGGGGGGGKKTRKRILFFFLMDEAFSCYIWREHSCDELLSTHKQAVCCRQGCRAPGLTSPW